MLSSNWQSNHVMLFYISLWQQVANHLVIRGKRFSDAWMRQVDSLWLATAKEFPILANKAILTLL